MKIPEAIQTNQIVTDTIIIEIGTSRENINIIHNFYFIGWNTFK